MKTFANVTRRQTLAIAGGAVAAGALPFSKGVQAAVKRGGAIAVSVPAAVKTLDPHKVVSHESYPATFHIFSALTRIGPDFSAQPELAERWESSPDAKTWTFHLYRNAKFHNGRQVTAADVQFSLERVLDEKQSPRGFKTIGPIAKVVAKDSATVVIELSKPYVDLPVDLGGIYPRIVAKENINDINTNPVGSGPYKLKSWTPEGNTVLVRNPDYHLNGEDGRSIPYLEELRVIPIKEPTSELAALQTNLADIMLQFPPEMMETAQRYNNVVVEGAASGYHSISLHQAPHGSYTAADHPNEFKYFKDKRVRQAFAHIFNREAALKAALGGQGVVGNDQPVPPNHVYGNPSLKPRAEDIALAKKLLAGAGVPAGAKFKLYTTAGRPGLKELALIFREMARPAGLDILVEVVDISRYWTDVEYKAPFYLDNWGARATIAATVNPFYRTGGGNNSAFLSDSKLDEVLDAAEGEMTFAKRRDLYWKAMEMISDHAATLVPYFKKHFQARRADLRGFQVHPLTYVWLDRAWKDA